MNLIWKFKITLKLFLLKNIEKEYYQFSSEAENMELTPRTFEEYVEDYGTNFQKWVYNWEV